MRRAISSAASIIGIACACSRPAEAPWLSCSFHPILDERDTVAHCARSGADGRLIIEPAALDVLKARGVDPAEVFIGGTLHYLNAVGIAVPVLPFDNGADYFVEGLARTLQGGKIGFIDESLAVVIPPAWDFAAPFHDAVAVVCDGCRPHPIGDGHEVFVGGRWGMIDKQGRVVVPLIHSEEAIRSMQQR